MDCEPNIYFFSVAISSVNCVRNVSVSPFNLPISSRDLRQDDRSRCERTCKGSVVLTEKI